MARDLIRREPNPDDLREAFLALTVAGRDLYETIAPLALDYERRLTAEIGEADLAALSQLLERLLRRAAEMRDADTPPTGSG